MFRIAAVQMASGADKVANLATALAFPISVALAVSMIRRGVTRPRPRSGTPAAPAGPELAQPGEGGGTARSAGRVGGGPHLP